LSRSSYQLKAEALAEVVSGDKNLEFSIDYRQGGIMQLKISRTGLLIITATMLFVSNPQITAGEAKIVNPVKPVINPTLQKRTPDYLREQKASIDSSNSEDLAAELREVLMPVYFSLNSSSLSAEAIWKIDKISIFLKSHPTVRLLAEGHADEPGDAQSNMVMGESRALSVKNYLTQSGIAADKVATTSYGKERPIFYGCGSDESCRAKNRRVEWQVLSK
jgi:outer membrane protein OmpA-like peptidoglycan-associated protein